MLGISGKTAAHMTWTRIGSENGCNPSLKLKLRISLNKVKQRCQTGNGAAVGGVEFCHVLIRNVFLFVCVYYAAKSLHLASLEGVGLNLHCSIFI